MKQHVNKSSNFKAFPFLIRLPKKKDKPRGIRIQKEIKCEIWVTLPWTKFHVQSSNSHTILIFIIFSTLNCSSKRKILQGEIFYYWIDNALKLSMLQFKYGVHCQQSTSQSSHMSPLGLVLKLHVPPSRLSPVGQNGALIVEVEIKLYVDEYNSSITSSEPLSCYKGTCFASIAQGVHCLALITNQKFPNDHHVPCFIEKYQNKNMWFPKTWYTYVLTTYIDVLKYLSLFLIPHVFLTCGQCN